MRIKQVTLVASVVALALAGMSGAVKAQTAESHVLTLRLPDGRIEQIRYVGDVPPTVVLAPTVPAEAVSPFALMRQMAADMDRQAAALLQSVNAADSAGFGVMPVLSGSGVCARSVQITFAGNGQAPHVVSQTAGDCGGPSHDQAAPAALPAAPVTKRPAPALVEAMAESPYPARLASGGDWQR
jgi:hypothetical protein